MLNVAIPPGKAPTWQKIGTEADDFVHTVVSVGDGLPLAFRSGVHCWLDDMVTQVSQWCREYTATTSVDFLLLPVAPSAACPCVDARLTLRDINFRRLMPSFAVSQCLQPVQVYLPTTIPRAPTATCSRRS